ncbi:LysR substrate-binding domain-containing protein [Pseudomonas soli]|uniref:LysR substrate-binding domain-containing protein n=1 Tax=Pseudomonas soli TaxID=1306993 RepID=UPI00299E05AF|nr:LysR substrate-binding domain-containing protein [Pseudomonas soli]
MVARPLAPYRLVLCASPHYISSHPPILALKDLSDHECLVFAHTDLRTQWTFKGPGGLIEVPVQGRFMADHGEALLSAAIAGLGVMLQPHELVSEALNNGSLVELLPQYAIPTRSLNLLYAQDRRMTPKLRSFVDFAVARFGDGSPRLL